jgi:hypothetical protein
MVAKVNGDFHKPEFDDGDFVYITFLSKVKGVIKVKCKFQGAVTESERGITQDISSAFNIEEGPTPEERITLMCKGLNSYRAENLKCIPQDFTKQNKLRLKQYEIGNVGEVHATKMLNNNFRRCNAQFRSE